MEVPANLKEMIIEQNSLAHLDHPVTRLKARLGSTMSETSAARSVLAPYCVGLGLDLGFGGSAISPTAITFDMPQMYCPSLEGHRQHLRGDATNMPFICDEAFDYIYSSHLIEDFYYDELIGIISEWRRILAPGGVLVLNAPDQKKFLAHCDATGQS